MVCASCVRVIESVLRDLDGVLGVQVNLAAENARITYNPAVATVADIRAAIGDTGYQYLGIEGGVPEDAEEPARQRDLADKLRRFSVGFAVSIPLFLLMLFQVPAMLTLPVSWNLVMLIVTAPVFVYVVSPIFQAASAALRHRSLTMDVMYAMGIGVAFGLVLTAAFNFYDTAVMLASFLTLGRYLEARGKAGRRRRSGNWSGRSAARDRHPDPRR